MIKKAFLILSLLTLLAAGFSWTGEAARHSSSTSSSSFVSSPQNEISINPLMSLLYPMFPIEYQYTLNSTSAIAGRIGFGGWGYGSWSTSIFGFGGSYRFFLLKDKVAPAGLWVGPAADLMIVSSSYTYPQWDPTLFTYRDVKDSATSLFVDLGAEAGYAWIFRNALGRGVHISLAPSLFLGYMIGSMKIAGVGLNMGGLALGLGCSVGIAF